MLMNATQGSEVAMDWKQRALEIFDVPKPEHFGNYQHCCECAEHDRTLSEFDRNSIGLEQLGNPGWDPLCFAHPEGLVYYLPALIRITLDTISTPSEQYLGQFLFHLIKDGPGNTFVEACSHEQRQFVAAFLEYLIEHHTVELHEDTMTSQDVLRAHEIWSV
jgi:hypothetical protein